TTLDNKARHGPSGARRAAQGGTAMSTDENKEKTAVAHGASFPKARFLTAPVSRAMGALGRQKGTWEARRREQGSWEKDTYHAEAGSREYFVYTPAHYQP